MYLKGDFKVGKVTFASFRFIVFHHFEVADQAASIVELCSSDYWRPILAQLTPEEIGFHSSCLRRDGGM